MSLCLCVALLSLGCSHTWSPPPRTAPVPRPTIHVRTPDGWTPMTPEQATAFEGEPTIRPSDGDSRDHVQVIGPFSGADRPLPRIPVLESLSGPQRPGWKSQPVFPRQYYVRPEHNPTGYTPGEYGRLDNYTPGQHTSRGYVEGHYRADGALYYTRPEHTSTGYLPGHYRAEPRPVNVGSPSIPINPISSSHPGLPHP